MTGILTSTRIAYTHPWCHPNCQHPYPHSAASAIALVGKRDEDHFSGELLAREPPTCPTYLRSGYQARKFSSASRSRRRSESTLPFRTPTLLRIAVGGNSHTLFDQRGSD